MKHAFALVLVLLMLAMSAACSEDPDPTPAPTPAPTPEAAGYASYENQELGVSLMYPSSGHQSHRMPRASGWRS